MKFKDKYISQEDYNNLNKEELKKEKRILVSNDTKAIGELLEEIKLKLKALQYKK